MNSRAFKYPRDRRDANGNKICAVLNCDKPIPKGRRSWCSNEHMRLGYFKLSRFAGAIHWRDGGICALCGMDCDALLKWLGANGTGAHRALKSLGFDIGGVLWHADHIIPVMEGGPTTLENGRILCHPCHKRITAEMHHRHKIARRAGGQLPLVPGD